MAAVAGTVKRAHGFTCLQGDAPNLTVSSAEYQLWGCFVDVEFAAGTYVQADDATFAPGTVIAAALRDGKTITVLHAACAQAGDENGALVGASDCTVSTGTVTCGLTKEDQSTERDAGAMSATWNRPITFFVSFLRGIAS